MRLDLTGLKRQVIFTAAEGWEVVAGGIAIRRDGQEAIFGAGPRDANGVQYDLWRLPLTTVGAQPERLTRGGGIMPAYSPISSHVAYRNPREATGLYLMDLTSHTTQKLLSDSARAMYFHPAFSPDGRTLAVSQLTYGIQGQGSQGQEQPRLISHLYLLSLSGRE